MEPDYYDRNGMPISMERWLTLWREERHVDQTEIGDWWVSTVWLGLDHGFGPNHKPLIFETMIFEGGDATDLYMDRYSTEEDAHAGHEVAVAWLRNHLAQIEELTEQAHEKHENGH